MSKSRSNLFISFCCRLKFYESYVFLSLHSSIFVNFTRTVKFRRWNPNITEIYFCNFFSIFFYFFFMCNVNFQCTKIFCVLYWIFVTNWIKLKRIGLFIPFLDHLFHYAIYTSLVHELLFIKNMSWITYFQKIQNNNSIF